MEGWLNYGLFDRDNKHRHLSQSYIHAKCHLPFYNILGTLFTSITQPEPKVSSISFVITYMSWSQKKQTVTPLPSGSAAWVLNTSGKCLGMQQVTVAE